MTREGDTILSFDDAVSKEKTKTEQGRLKTRRKISIKKEGTRNTNYPKNQPCMSRPALRITRIPSIEARKRRTRDVFNGLFLSFLHVKQNEWRKKQPSNDSQSKQASLSIENQVIGGSLEHETARE
jgi:hypothetical protein